MKKQAHLFEINDKFARRSDEQIESQFKRALERVALHERAKASETKCTKLSVKEAKVRAQGTKTLS